MMKKTKKKVVMDMDALINKAVEFAKSSFLALGHIPITTFVIGKDNVLTPIMMYGDSADEKAMFRTVVEDTSRKLDATCIITVCEAWYLKKTVSEKDVNKITKKNLRNQADSIEVLVIRIVYLHGQHKSRTFFFPIIRSREKVTLGDIVDKSEDFSYKEKYITAGK